MVEGIEAGVDFGGEVGDHLISVEYRHGDQRPEAVTECVWANREHGVYDESSGRGSGGAERGSAAAADREHTSVPIGWAIGVVPVRVTGELA